MSFTLTRSGWQMGYRIISCIQCGILVIVLLSLPLWKKKQQKQTEEVTVKPIGLASAVKIKGVLPVIIGFWAYCALESTATLWSSSYFEGVLGSSKDEAAALGSLVFIGITVGRFAAGFITERLGDSKMIRIGAAVAVVGIILTALPYKAVVIAGFVVLGLGCAPIYPCIIHSTPARFGKERSQSIIGIQMASAYLGSTLMPPLFGLIANHISIALMPLYIAFFLVLMLVLLILADRLTLKEK